MNKHKTLKQGLLEQDGLELSHMADQRRKKIEMILMREQNRLRHMRWITASLWLLLVASYVFWGILGAEGRKIESLWLTAWFAVTILLWPVAIVSTILLYVRSRAADAREIKLRLAEIEESLNRLAGRS